MPVRRLGALGASASRGSERLETRRRAPAANDNRASIPAPARRLLATTSRRIGRVLSSSTACGRRACCSSRDSRGDAGNNPLRRQGDQIVAPGSTGRRLLVEDDHWRLRQDADIEQPDCVAAGVGGPVVLSKRAHARMDVPVGEGVRSATLRTIKRRSTPGAGSRPLSPAVAVVGAGPDGALACRPQQASEAETWRRSLARTKGGARLPGLELTARVPECMESASRATHGLDRLASAQ
jgi:hypothetical protein